jgi:hypothetical protein
MLSIKTKETKQSTSCEGVSFTIRKLSRIQRSQRDLPIFEQRLKADDLMRRFWELTKEREALKAGDPAAGNLDKEIASVDYEFALIQSSHLAPASIRAGLVSITGLEIDGQPATPEMIATNATPELDDLVREIYAECEVASGLTGAQKKNSPSPTTSNEPGIGEATSSTAGPASA